MRHPLYHLSPVLLLALALVGFVGLQPGAETEASQRAVYTIDKSHSSIGFKVRHLGISTVTGTFSDYDVRLEVDPNDLKSMRARARIDVASVYTGNVDRDDDLRSENFFDVETHPEIRFESTGVEAVDGDRFKLAGELTIRGVTKPVVLDGQLLGTTTGPMGKERVGLEATTTIDRRDFDLTWNRLTEAGGVIVGHDVTIMLVMQAVRAGA
jgi:polyisoprenoid-binding protein YceI